MARQSSRIHRVDARAKVFTTFVFIIMVVSVDKYALSQLLPFLLFPVILVTIGDLPAMFFLKKILLVAPFAFFLGIFNPLLDRSIILHIGSISISGGWISFLSLMLRFALTVGAALILIGVTGFNGICMALLKFRIPRIFVSQLQFLYRYLFVLLDEARRMARARVLRAFSPRAPRLQTFSSMLGNLLLRATARAERVHLAMCCRGYNGTVHVTNTPRFRLQDGLFVVGWCCLFLLFRMYNIPLFLGAGALGVLQ